MKNLQFRGNPRSGFGKLVIPILISLMFLTVFCNPTSSKKMHKQGLKLYHSFEYDRAREVFEKALEKYPDQYVIWKDLGNIYLTGYEDYGKAEECYQKALAIKPDYPNAQHNIALILEKEGKLEPALAQFKKIVKAYPKFYFSYIEMANIYLARNNVQMALDSVRRGVSLNPTYPQGLYLLALIYYNHKKDYRSAEKYLIQLMENAPDYGDAYFLASEIYSRIGWKVKALKFMKKYYKWLKKNNKDKKYLKKAELKIRELKHNLHKTEGKRKDWK